MYSLTTLATMQIYSPEFSVIMFEVLPYRIRSDCESNWNNKRTANATDIDTNTEYDFCWHSRNRTARNRSHACGYVNTECKNCWASCRKYACSENFTAICWAKYAERCSGSPTLLVYIVQWSDLVENCPQGRTQYSETNGSRGRVQVPGPLPTANLADFSVNILPFPVKPHTDPLGKPSTVA